MPRHRRGKSRTMVGWPPGKPSPGQVAGRVCYLGSPEHKRYPNENGEPGNLKSDKSECRPIPQDESVAASGELRVDDTRHPGVVDRIKMAIQDGMAAGCVSTHQFDGDFPKFVWWRIGEQLYEAQLREVRQQRGIYKGYPVRPEEEPDDPKGLLKES